MSRLVEVNLNTGEIINGPIKSHKGPKPKIERGEVYNSADGWKVFILEVESNNVKVLLKAKSKICKGSLFAYIDKDELTDSIMRHNLVFGDFKIV